MIGFLVWAFGAYLVFVAVALVFSWVISFVSDLISDKPTDPEEPDR